MPEPGSDHRIHTKPMLKIHNPATGQLLAEVPEATAGIVAERARAARAAQPAWFAMPIEHRLQVLQRFRVAVAAELEVLAATLTAEVGKPIRQSRNELNGLLTRIDFFLTQARAIHGRRYAASRPWPARPPPARATPPAAARA